MMTFETTDHSPASLRVIRTSHVCPTLLTHCPLTAVKIVNLQGVTFAEGPQILKC
jgi:hypothetical protein